MKEFERPNYTYRAVLDRVIDGDTIDVWINLGFRSLVFKRLRLIDIDTDELRDPLTERKERAQSAKARVEEILGNADRIYVQTVLDATGKFGRVLAWVWYEVDGKEPVCLNYQLLNEGYQKQPE